LKADKPLGLYVIGSDEERFWIKVERRTTDECWPWLATIRSDGYGGSFRTTEGRYIPPHKFAFLLSGGTIPHRYHIDHNCHNLDMSCSGGPQCVHRRCCNPRHLRAIDTVSNSIAGRALKNRCPEGHLKPEWQRGRRRRCLTCHAAQERRRTAAGPAPS